jgi:aspartate/methionine/tyrosine aminotransferase
MQAVQSPIIPVVGRLIRDHPGTISLGQGVVNYPPPPQAIAHLEYFLANPENHKYRPVHGIPELIEQVSRKLAQDNGVEVGGGRNIVVTAGGNMAFMNAVLTITDPGDEIILLTPYYFNHDMAVAIAGCRTVCAPTDEDFQPRIEAIAGAITARTRAVVTISPNNPTGAVYPEETLRRINALCKDRGIYHIHDEAYEYFTYDGAKHFSPGAIPGGEAHTLSLFSLSKSFGLASWRIGYMLIPAHLLVSVHKVQDTNLICPPVISQWAAVGAMKAGGAYCREQVAKLAEVRQLVLERLGSLGDLVTAPPARGAFYCLIRVRTGMDAMELVTGLRQMAG